MREESQIRELKRREKEGEIKENATRLTLIKSSLQFLNSRGRPRKSIDPHRRQTCNNKESAAARPERLKGRKLTLPLNRLRADLQDLRHLVPIPHHRIRQVHSKRRFQTLSRGFGSVMVLRGVEDVGWEGRELREGEK